MTKLNNALKSATKITDRLLRVFSMNHFMSKTFYNTSNLEIRISVTLLHIHA